MNSRDRLIDSLNHKQPDKPVIDFGSTFLTGIHVSTVYKLRQYFKLDSPGKPVKVIEPYQMLGEIKQDLMEVLGCDIASTYPKYTAFGFPNSDYKKWKLDCGTPVLVPRLFNTVKNADGSVYQYPYGDRSNTPSAIMPYKGFYFDAIIRKKGADDSNLDPKENLEEYKSLSEAELNSLYKNAKTLYDNSQYGIVTVLPGTSFGDIFTIPGISLSDPKGIRDIEEWYISLYSRKKYIKRVFAGQLEIGLENLKKITKILSDKVQVLIISGTDFGTQNGLFISLDTYRELFKPYFKKINDFIHESTSCKTFIHSCGGIYDLIPELIDTGFDILNPVQISAKGMEPERLKIEFGKYITFWGGGIDTQKTLPLGTPKEVSEETKRLIDIFSKDGGYVFAAVHNIQANIPLENIVALIEAISNI